jgi:hypothetical protein
MYGSMIPRNVEKNLPSECEKRACEEMAVWWVRFTNPNEYVAYCDEHKREEIQSDAGDTITSGRL